MILDTCLLEPPEPFELALKELQQLQAGQVLHMIHRRAPQLLYEQLPQLGIATHTCQSAALVFHILMWKQVDTVAEVYSQQLINQLCVPSSCN
ncbi:MAG: DUF2249 domain-containing protein [Gammaproteobacteria bacterium]|nr:DUF2249 domain-containing protein [Gammaproteobacteria bacterium]MCP4879911.1 DUF2249 domain-containing protein [Gammaproteobacteria bacterium]